jgi:hypothetical protein
MTLSPPQAERAPTQEEVDLLLERIARWLADVAEEDA